MIGKKSQLERWNFLLSAEIIDCWISSQSETAPFNQFLDLLKILKVETHVLIEELEKKIIELKNSKNLANKIDLEGLIDLQKEISDWYYENYIDRIRSYYKDSNLKAKNEFVQFINSFWLKASLHAALNFSDKIGNFLVSYQKEYRQERQTLLRQENGGKKTYDVTVYKIVHYKDNRELANNFELAIKALLHIYKCKVQAEICDLKLHWIKMMMLENQIVIDNLVKSGSFLNEVKQKYPIEKNYNNLLIPMLFDRLCIVKSPENIKQEIEEYLGISLNRWGCCGYIEAEKVSQLLLEKVSAITEKSYKSLIQELTSETIFEEENESNINQNTVSLN